eukprot:1051712-Pyramimonas_sp.AAC.1
MVGRMPPRGKQACNDPISRIKFVKATLNEKDLRKTGKTFRAAVEAMFPEKAAELLDEAKKCPGRSLLWADRARVQCVAALLRRREWASEAPGMGAPPACWHALGVDASPQIGLEIFGCISYRAEAADLDCKSK